MTYRAGLSLPGAARSPTISCDAEGCATRIVIEGLPPAWFLSGGAKRGWQIVREGETRRDYCPLHAGASENR